MEYTYDPAIDGRISQHPMQVLEPLAWKLFESFHIKHFVEKNASSEKLSALTCVYVVERYFYRYFQFSEKAQRVLSDDLREGPEGREVPIQH